MMSQIIIYTSAFGKFEIPKDIYMRSIRYKESRPRYLDEWCEYQWKKGRV